MKFGFFDGDLSDRHDVFLYKEYCQIIPPDQLERARPHLPPTHQLANCYVPSNEFLKWLADNGIDHSIHAVWPDGCSVFLIKPTEEDLAMVKLSWNPNLCRS